MTPDRWRKAQEVFHAATEHEPGLRAAFLEETCRNDPELQSEVESLLSSYNAAPSKFLESPAIEGVPALPPTAAPGARSLGKGKQLGPYEILGSLGAGGMGEVYRARDLRLGREVAIKVLPAEWSSEASRVKRFEQEARSASALNHPNIVTVYDTGISDGVAWIAMERIEGLTLRELLGGPMATRKLLGIAAQVTEGLAKAHEAGIVHRDLKPENVMVTRDGLVKILDFGLAKLTATGSGSGEGSKLPTMTGTTPGVIVGTVEYMSPEQAGGERIDFRSDQFSFGSILYEMATGKRAFQGKTPIDVLGAILNEEPQQIASITPQTPTQLRWIVERCLSKEARQRYSSTDDLARDLATLRDHLSEATSGAAAAAQRRRPFWRPALGGALVLLLAAGAVWQLTRRQPPPKPPLRVRQLTSNSAENPVDSGEMSLDGKYLAYTDSAGMHIKLIESGEIQSVPEPEELKGRGMVWEAGPWHPDGTRFYANAHPGGWELEGGPSSQGTSIWTVLVMGGPPRKLRDDAQVYSVSPDGSSVAFGVKKVNSGSFGEGDREIWLMGPGGEHARKLFQADPNSALLGTAWFRDGQRVAYLRFDAAGVSFVSRPLKGGPVTTILPSKMVDQATTDRISSCAWSPDGRLIYSLPEVQADNVIFTANFWELPIDPHTGEALGEPRRLTTWSGFGINSSGLIAEGKRLTFLKWIGQNTVYLAPLEAGGTAIGTPRHFTLSEGSMWPADWTGDAKTLVLTSNQSGHSGIYRQSLNEETPEPLVVGPEDAEDPCVSPDSAWVLYRTSVATGDAALPLQFLRAPIGGGPSQVVMKARPASWVGCARSPAELCVVGEPTANRKELVFTAFDPVKGRGEELMRVDVDPSGGYVGSSGFLSPDGTRIALWFSAQGPIHILSLLGKPPQRVTVRGWDIRSLRWAADGNALIVGAIPPGRAVLLHVDFQGNAKVLWQQPGSRWVAGLNSPDGRHLAIAAFSFANNIWMMENF